MKILLSRVQTLNEAMDDMKTDLVLVRTEQGSRFVTPGSTPEDATDELMDYIMSEDKDVTSTRRSSTSVVVTPTKGSSDDDEEDKSVMSILSKLVDDVKNLQSGKQTMSIQFAGLGFSDLSECAAWIEKHYSGYQYGLIMDPLLMLDRIFGLDDITDADALLKSMEVRYKMKIDSGNEASALSALLFPRPRIFHKGKATVVSVPNKSRLNLLPSHLDWNPGGEGIMDDCVAKLNSLELAIEGEIGETFEIDSMAYWITNKCLKASLKFLTQLFQSVESIYKKLHNFSKFTTEQAWALK
jgi:hypothetical protein